MEYCDNTPSVIEWSSEEIQVPYYNPIDQRHHRYFIDFWIKVKDINNNIKCYLIEIKPEKYTKEPKIPKKKSKEYYKMLYSWIINKNKWQAAQKYCEEKQWEFKILTENHLFKKK